MIDRKQDLLNILKKRSAELSKIIPDLNKEAIEKKISEVLLALKTLTEEEYLDGNKIIETCEKPPAKKKR
jgi:hypothetical protein